MGLGIAERVVQHRAQMLLELAGAGAVHGPVTGVVRSHRQLVDHQAAVDSLEQLDRQHARPRPAPTASRSASCPAALPISPSRPGAGAITSTQMPSRCTVSTTGHAAPWPNGDRATNAASSRRIATRSSTKHRDPLGEIAAREVAGLVQVAGQQHPATVVAAARGLDHDRLARGERVEVRDIRHLGIPRNRGADRLQLAPHHQLVLGVDQRLRRRRHVHALGDQLLEQFGRHVLVVEREHVGALGRAAKRIEVGVRADHHVGCDLRRGIVAV